MKAIHLWNPKRCGIESYHMRMNSESETVKLAQKTFIMQIIYEYLGLQMYKTGAF